MARSPIRRLMDSMRSMIEGPVRRPRISANIDDAESAEQLTKKDQNGQTIRKFVLGFSALGSEDEL